MKKMIIAGIFVFLICGSVTTSASIYGVQTDCIEEWWLQKFFLKFYSPSGKNYYIDHINGEISLERLNPFLPNEKASEKVDTPYISFVSLNLKVYDIFFELQENNLVPHIVQTKYILEDNADFIRHSLHSFVGPDNQVYKLVYRNISDISILAEEPPKYLDHLQIKTLGPYSKWEHIYDFSKNGDLVTDLTLSPTLPNRSIPLPEMESTILKDRGLLLIDYNTPSGTKYLLTNDLNIASANGQRDEPYIKFIEPNGKEYEIHFRADGNRHIPQIAPKDNQDEVKNEFGLEYTRLFSFVGPDEKQYRIDHTNQNDPTLVVDCEPNLPTDFQITVLETNEYYRKYIKFIFSNQGKELFDRVEELDWTPLSEQPEINVDEVEANSDVATSSFLTFYSPSGKTYYITPNETKANIAVEKVNSGNSKTQVSYIKFLLQDGRTGHIYLSSGGDPRLEIDSNNQNQSTTKFSLKSFVTPNRKSYKLAWMLENDIRIPFIDRTSQPKDPLDEIEERSLKITIMGTAREFHYQFTLTGEKLVGTSSRPLKRISSRLVGSLIGK